MAPKQNFGKGSKVEEKKKTSTRGIGEIIGVSEKALNVSLDRRKQWIVKWPDGTIESKTSAQLRRPVDKAAADASLMRVARVAGKAAAPIQRQPSSPSPATPPRQANLTSTSSGFTPSDDEEFSFSSDDVCDADSSLNITVVSVDDGMEVLLTPRPLTPRPPSRSNSVDGALNPADDELELDPDDDVIEEDVHLNDFDHSHIGADAIEDPDEFRRASRQRKYEAEKKELIDCGFTVTKKISKKAFVVGAKVQTKKKDPLTKRPREGIIVKKVDDVGAGGGQKKTYSWEVSLDSGASELFKSQALK